MQRGLVVPLTPEQRRNRALYVAGELAATGLDEFVRNPTTLCPTIYYRMEYPNGGDDPTAPSPAARWKKPGATFENVTAECFAGVAWEQGFDRVQPKRAARVWGGHLNCDSALIEAREYGDCFELLVDEHGRPRPEVGCIVMYESVDYDHDGDRDDVGHTATITEVPPEWDARERDCWAALGAVHIHYTGGPRRANVRTNGLTFWGNHKHGAPKKAQFLRCVMEPGV